MQFTCDERILSSKVGVVENKWSVLIYQRQQVTCAPYWKDMQINITSKNNYGFETHRINFDWLNYSMQKKLYSQNMTLAKVSL